MLALLAALAPALGAQSASDATLLPVAPSPAGVALEPRSEVAIEGSVPTAWTRSLARADSLAPRKRAFKIGALAGAVLTTGFALAVSQPWKEDGGDTDSSDPGAGFLVATSLVGALLGGFTGVIVHDVHGAVRRP